MFCRTCGGRLPKPRMCAACASPLRSDERFCGRCGVTAGAAATGGTEASAGAPAIGAAPIEPLAAPGRGTGAVPIVGGLIALIVLVVAGLIVVGPWREGSTEQEGERATGATPGAAKDDEAKTGGRASVVAIAVPGERSYRVRRGDEVELTVAKMPAGAELGVTLQPTEFRDTNCCAVRADTGRIVTNARGKAGVRFRWPDSYLRCAGAKNCQPEPFEPGTPVDVNVCATDPTEITCERAEVDIGGSSDDRSNGESDGLLDVSLPGWVRVEMAKFSGAVGLVPRQVPDAWGLTEPIPANSSADDLAYNLVFAAGDRPRAGGYVTGEGLQTGPVECMDGPGQVCAIFERKGKPVHLMKSGSAGDMYYWEECGLKFTVGDYSAVPRDQIQTMIEQLEPIAQDCATE